MVAGSERSGAVGQSGVARSDGAPGPAEQRVGGGGVDGRSRRDGEKWMSVRVAAGAMGKMKG
jgi:hypothetical protein